MRPTPQEIKRLHDWLEKEMPSIFPDSQQQWEIREGEKSPRQGVLWVNSNYVQKADDLVEIINTTLLLYPNISKIEMQPFAGEASYAKLGVLLGQRCLVLKECTLEILKDLRFTIKTNENKNNLSVTIKSANDSKRILLYSGKQISESCNKVLSIILSHAISLKPTANDDKAVKNVFGELNEDTKRIISNLLNTEFIKAFIHEEGDYYLNPFASYLQKNFEECTEPMWGLVQGCKLFEAKEKGSKETFFSKESESFKQKIGIDSNSEKPIYIYERLKLGDLTAEQKEKYKDFILEEKALKDLTEDERRECDKSIKLYTTRKMVKELTRDEKKRYPEVSNLPDEDIIEIEVFKKVSELDYREKTKYGESIIPSITVGTLSESEKKKYAKVIVDYNFRELNQEEQTEYKGVIDSSDFQWLIWSQVLIEDFVKLENNEKDVRWTVDKKRADSSEKTKKSIAILFEKTLKHEEGDVDIVENWIKQIREDRGNDLTKINTIYRDRKNLYVILGTLFNFIKNNYEYWDQIVIQFAEKCEFSAPLSVTGLKGITQRQDLRGLLHRLKQEGKYASWYLDDLSLFIENGNNNEYKRLLTYYKLNEDINTSLFEEEKSKNDRYTIQSNEKTPLDETANQIGQE